MIHSNFKAFTLSLFSIFSGFFNVAYANTITKKAYVEIVTGTYAGQTGEAIFSYDTDRISGNGQESIKGNGILFNFLGQIVTGQPTILLEDGEFKDLAWTGTLNGPYGRTFNFGFNSGFTKRKFSRPDESFVQKGPYFGYLNSSSLVDGAGTVQYKGDECKMQNTDPRVISNNVLEHTKNPLKHITSLHRVLKKKGKIIFIIPCDSQRKKFVSTDINKHFFSWSPMNIGNLFVEAGFRVERVTPFLHKWPPLYELIEKYLGMHVFHAIAFMYGFIDRDWIQVKIVATKI